VVRRSGGDGGVVPLDRAGGGWELMR
jgi:hypothetical protein